MQSTKVVQLKGMFPDMDNGTLASVLSAKNDNLDQAIEALLALNVTALSPEEKKVAKQNLMTEVIQKVLRMPSDSEARKLAGNFGLHINTVAWEDTARTKGSVWGPCISDMTLMVEGSALPLVRYPNYEDLTWDVPMEKIPLVVGNEIGGKLYTITLKEYLEHFRMYLHKPSSWKGDKTSLLAERDSHVIMSSQACFLPVPKGAEATFNVSIFNYQSSPGNPAVLAITATSQGTSAQIVDGSGYGGQKLFFNKNGEKASFVGQRLSDNRKERGVSTQGEMTQQEKQQNMIMVIQVPLKQKKQPRRNFFGYGGGGGDFGYDCLLDDECEETLECCAPSVQSTSMNRSRSVKAKEEADVEEAIIKIGESEGEFREAGDLAIERDTRYPVRVTLQFYKSTANGVINEKSVRTIASQIEQSRKNADFVGSLVVGGQTGRPTEHKQPAPHKTPDWWPVFWLSYGPTFSQYTEEGAKNLLFKDGRFTTSSLDDVKSQMLSILGGGGCGGGGKIYLPPQEPVDWPVLGGEDPCYEPVYEE